RPGLAPPQVRRARQQLLPPDAARKGPAGLPEPDEAQHRLAPGGLLLQAAHGQGAARGPRQGADRAQRLRVRRDASSARRGAPRRRTEARRLLPGRLRRLLPGGDAPRRAGDQRRVRRVLKGLVALSKETGIPLVATNDSHYTAREDAPIHDVLLCIGTNSTVDDAKRQLKMHDDSYYVKSEEEMLALFPDLPEAVTNTQLVAEQCNLELEFGRLHLPEPEIPAGVTPHEHLTRLARAGLERRYGNASDDVRSRLQYELDVVEKTGFTNYFLVVHDIAQFCRRENIMLGVRGSAAASIILYTLDVTFIDPLANRLVFERFLHVDRKEPPDVDLDIPDDRRDEV